MSNLAAPDPVELFHKILAANSTATLILVGLGMATWLIGGNLVVAWHYRRMGKSPFSGLRPFAFPFKDFNGREWAALGGVAAVTFTLFGIAMSLK